jgi:hypothetical protein
MRYALYAVLPFVTLSCQRETLRLLPEGVDAGSAGAGGISARVLVDGAATGCTESGECGGRRQHCELSTGRCVECLSASHCDPPLTCDLIPHECSMPCTRDGDRTRDGTPRCSTARGVCVECRGDDSDCTSQTERFCEPETLRCVGCLADAHCPTQAPFCNLERHSCEECLRDDQCSSSGRCDSGRCVVSR